eukprot:scaffold62557_cov69-Phaeocystis_antarctica.AAC.4
MPPPMPMQQQQSASKPPTVSEARDARCKLSRVALCAPAGRAERALQGRCSPTPPMMGPIELELESPDAAMLGFVVLDAPPVPDMTCEGGCMR